MVSPRFPKLPTPLEVGDGVLDTVAEVLQLPGRVVGAVGGAIQGSASAVNAGIRKPQDYAEVPAPPDVILSGVIDAATGVVSQVVGGVTGAIDAFRQTGEGVQRQVNELVKR